MRQRSMAGGAHPDGLALRLGARNESTIRRSKHRYLSIYNAEKSSNLSLALQSEFKSNLTLPQYDRRNVSANLKLALTPLDQ